MLRSFTNQSVLVALVLALAACAPAGRPTAGTAITPEAVELRAIPVSHVEVQVGVGSPIPVDVFVSGGWPDLCAQLAETRQSVEGDRIEITLLATPADPDCPPDFVGLPFRIAVPLNVVELPVGLYTVAVNGVSTTFDWQQGNTTPTVPLMNAVQVDEVNIEIEGSRAVKSVRAIVSGRLPDICAQVNEIRMQREGTTFQIVVLASSSAGEGCVADGVPFQLVIPLNSTNLPAGPYDVNVNGVSASFDPRATP